MRTIINWFSHLFRGGEPEKTYHEELRTHAAQTTALAVHVQEQRQALRKVARRNAFPISGFVFPANGERR